MRVPVLVLHNSRNCFQEEIASGLDPIFYESLPECPAQKGGDEWQPVAKRR